MQTTMTEAELRIQQLRAMAEIRGRHPGSDAKMDALSIASYADQLAHQYVRVKAWEKHLSGQKLTTIEEKALSTETGPNGGYLAPDPKLTEYLRRAQPISPVYDKVTQRTLVKGDNFPVAKEETALQVLRRAETDQHTITADLGIAMERIPTHDLVATPKVSNALLEGDPSFADRVLLPGFLDSAIATESKEILVGSGVGQSEGVLNHPNIAIVNSGDANLLKADGITKLYYKVPEPYRSRGYWIMRGATAEAVKTLKDSQNQPIFRSGEFGVSPDTIHNRPVLTDDSMPAVAANAFPIIFGDLQWFYLIVRVALAVFRDPFSSPGFVIFDMTRRSGGQVVRPAAFAKQKIAA